MKKNVLYLLLLLSLMACRNTPVVTPQEELLFHHGLYLLNEGNMGSNKATIDFYDIEGDSLIRDIYPTVNPSQIKELGDVGNDIAIYGGKLYAVINVSGKIEVMNSQARRIGQVDVPNCRSLAFNGAYAYVTSYAGPVDYNNPNYSQRGYVAKIDTASLEVIGTCLVGYQPNGIACDGQYLYVANSGGYMAPNYDSTVSVIALDKFEEVERIPVAVNLDALVFDPVHKALFVSSLGDYINHPAALYRINLTGERTIEKMPFAASKMCLTGESLYYYSYDYVSAQYGVLNTATLRNQALSFEGKEITSIVPYGLFVEHEGGDIYLTDARDYVTPGVLYRFTSEGKLLSKFRTGDIPGHFALKIK